MHEEVVTTTPWLYILISVVGMLGASSGFWAFVSKREKKKNTDNKLLVALAHDRIIHLGMVYIHRGWITRFEYIVLVDNLFKPYKDTGGNGLAEQIINEVKTLPIRDNERTQRGRPDIVISET